MNRTRILFLMLVLVSSIAHAENVLIITVDSYPDPVVITEIFVLEPNEFGDARFFDDQFQEETSFEIILEDSSGAIILRNELEGYTSHLEFDDKIAFIKLVSGEEVVHEQEVDFCDNDGVCEPCDDIECVNVENVLTCSDCASGNIDFFCDTIQDDLCDPDCNSDIADPDCLEEYLELEGVGEYVESLALMQNQPSLTILATGDTAAVARSEEYPGQYCTETAGGKLCGPEESCHGDIIEYVQGIRCCIGSCIEPEEEEGEVFPQDIEKPQDIDAISTYDEGLESIRDGELPYGGLAELGEKQTLSQKVEVAGKSVEKTLNKVNLFHVVGISLGVLLLVFLAVSIFQKSADKEVSGGLSSAQGNLQSDIDNLVSKGYSYQQIEQMLMQRGFEKSVVDSEINLNYQRRKGSVNGGTNTG